MKSKFFSLSFRDFLKGSIVAILTGVGTALTIDDPTFKNILMASGVSWCAYLVKNLFTNNRDEFLAADRK